MDLRETGGWEQIERGSGILFHNMGKAFPFTVAYIFVGHTEFNTALEALEIAGNPVAVNIRTTTRINIPLSRCSFLEISTGEAE